MLDIVHGCPILSNTASEDGMDNDNTWTQRYVPSHPIRTYVHEDGMDNGNWG